MVSRGKCMCVKPALWTLGHRFESPVQVGPKPIPGWEKSKSRPPAASFAPFSCLLRPPPTPRPQYIKRHKTKQSNNKQKQTHPCHLRDFSQFSPGKRELAVSFSEATRIRTASAGSHSGRSHSCHICMALRVRATFSLRGGVILPVIRSPGHPFTLLA